MDQRIAIRYSRALMDLAKDRNEVDRFSDDIELIHQALEVAKDLRAMLHSPVIRPHVKITVLREIFGPRISQDVLGFLELLVHKGRGDILYAIVKEFQNAVDHERNIVRALVSSAIPLTKAEQEAIGDRLTKWTGRTVVASYAIDPSLKGGFVVRIGDTQIDASLSHQLEVLREQFLRGGSAVLN